MAVRLARSLAASSPSRPSFFSIGNRRSVSDTTSSPINSSEISHFTRAFAFYSSSSFSWWSSPDDLTIGSKRREKKTTDRFSSVIDIVHDRKLPPELRGRRDFVRSETDIANVVEQRIWHSMEEGHFENLPGKGKPLNINSNPHADPAEDTLYRILNKNGFAPEWVELNKDIRSKAKEWRALLKKSWTMKLEEEDQSSWEKQSNLLKTEMKHINNMVFRYNLIAPFGRQMIGLNWEKEINRLNE